MIVYRYYRIIEDDDEYRVAENFGDYRILKKKFKSIAQAKMRINELMNKNFYKEA